jgi:hypothetical protein
MATLSFADLKNLAYPTLWDLAEMKKLQLADGATFDQMIGDVSAAARIMNGELLSMPHYGDLFAVQDNIEIEYPVGVTNGVEESSEYSTPTPKRGKTSGHSLPIKAYDRALGWTIMYLRKARRISLDADIRSAMVDIRDDWQKKLLTRFFKSTAEAVGATSGASVPFADGGTADSTYVPLSGPDGQSFLYTHNHFLRYDTIAHAIAPAVLHLREHGHVAPYDLIGSQTDQAVYAALTMATDGVAFHAPAWSDLLLGSQQDRARLGDINQYMGLIETPYGIVRLWLTPRVPTNYFGMFKSYGAGDARNPLRVRFDPKVGFGWQLVPGAWVNNPVTLAVMYAEYGFGIGSDRTNGVAVYKAAAGNYTDPTIS